MSLSVLSAVSEERSFEDLLANWNFWQVCSLRNWEAPRCRSDMVANSFIWSGIIVQRLRSLLWRFVATVEICSVVDGMITGVLLDVRNVAVCCLRFGAKVACTS
jgi:hypothetical protein